MKMHDNDNLEKSNLQGVNPKVLAVCDYVCCAFLALTLSASPYYTTQGDCPFSLALVLTTLFVFAALISVTFCLRKIFASKLWQGEKFPNNKVCNFVEKLLNCKHPVLAVGGGHTCLLGGSAHFPLPWNVHQRHLGSAASVYDFRGKWWR